MEAEVTSTLYYLQSEMVVITKTFLLSMSTFLKLITTLWISLIPVVVKEYVQLSLASTSTADAHL